MVPDRRRLDHQLRGTGGYLLWNRRYALSLVVPLPLPMAKGLFEAKAEKDEAEKKCSMANGIARARWEICSSGISGRLTADRLAE